MRKIIIGLLLLLSVGATAQWQQTGSKVRYVNGLGIPTKDTAAGVSADSSQIVIRPADSSLYVKYKRTWLRVGGGGGSIAGAGTLNRVAKFTSSNAIGNSSIYDNGTAVGINTLTPTTTLQVGDGTGNPEITASGLNYDVVLGTPSGSALGFTTVGNYVGVYSNSATKDLAFTHGNSRGITFGTGNQTRLTITASGRLLANTRTDNGVDALQVGGSMNVSTIATTNNLSVTTNATVGGNARVSGTLIAGTTADNGIDKLQVYGTSYYTSQMVQRTTSPRFFLDDNDNTGTASLWFRPQNASFSPRGALELISFGSAAGGELRMSAGAPGGGVTSSHYQTFYTAGVERLRITSGGQLNIGGSFTSTNNTLQVTGNAAIGYTTAAPTNGLIVAGNVGIGVASPVSALNISDGATMYAAGTGEMLQVKRNTTNTGVSSQVMMRIGNNTNAFSIIYGGANDRLRFVDGGSVDVMTLVNGGKVLLNTATDNGVDQLQVNGSAIATQFKLSALNTAPATASSTGTLGEIRIDANYIYICTATNTWKRVAIATW